MRSHLCWRRLALSLSAGALAWGLMGCGGKADTTCCAPTPDPVVPVEDNPVDEGTFIDDGPYPQPDLTGDVVEGTDVVQGTDVIEDTDAIDPDSDFDGIPDSEDIDVYEDSDMDGIPNDQDYSADNPILDNHENNMDATNVWTDDGSGW